jgi:hypothetical protein
MNRLFNGGRFTDFTLRNSDATFSDLEFQQCRFEACDVSITFDPAKRSTFKSIKFIRCSQNKCTIWPAIIEDVTVEGLETGRLLIANACAYKHVTLRGNVGNIKICRSVPFVTSLTEANLARSQNAMDQANAHYYKTVDWALDISQAEFMSGEVEGIPPELVRRDRDTQFILRRHAIKEGRWRQVEAARADWHTLLDAYDKENMDDVILIAPKAAPDFKSLLKGLIALREAGILEAS